MVTLFPSLRFCFPFKCDLGLEGTLRYAVPPCGHYNSVSFSLSLSPFGFLTSVTSNIPAIPGSFGLQPGLSPIIFHTQDPNSWPNSSLRCLVLRQLRALWPAAKDSMWSCEDFCHFLGSCHSRCFHIRFRHLTLILCISSISIRLMWLLSHGKSGALVQGVGQQDQEDQGKEQHT